VISSTWRTPTRGLSKTSACACWTAGPLAAVAATCLGHLARIHRQLDTDAVTAALDRQRGDELVGPRAEDALDDIDLYMGT